MNVTLPEIAPETLQSIPSPTMIVFRDRVVENIQQMIRMAGSPERLRPHCKTHKMAAVVAILKEHGITRHKAATIAEVEMLCEAGAADVLLAYNPVGPNIDRVIELLQKYPHCRIAVTCDHSAPLEELATAAEVAGVVVPVFLDVNVGMDRTGVPPGSDAAHHLLQALHDSASLELAGLHIYDGHQRATDLTERTAAVQEQWQQIETLRTWCRDRGIVLPKLVCGGTPTFPVYCGFEDPDIELSPGTSIFYDVGYGQLFPDLPFQPAAAVLTRVVSCPGRNRITLDLGTKAVASDPPKGSRVVFPELPGSVQIGHNEEHLQLEVPEDSSFAPGDVLLAIPTHVCPTSALYDRVPVVEGGQIVDYWEVTARSRAITV